MENIKAWLFRITSLKLIFCMGIIYLIFPGYLLPNIINTGSVSPLDLLFWYNQDTLYQMFNSYGQTVRSRYMVGLLTADLAYPIYYGMLLAIIFVFIIKKLAIPFSRNIIFIPFVVVFFDLAENTLLLFLLSQYPIKHNLIADIAGFITATKWSALIIVTLCLIYLVVYGLLKRKRTAHTL